MRLADPWWLLLAPLVLASAAFLLLGPGKRRARVHLSHPLSERMETLPQGWRARLAWMPATLRLLALLALVIALARPQGALGRETLENEGIDIMLVLDVSGSMRARDFEPNRLFAARDVAAKFVSERPNDRIGFVTFATTALTRSPLTIDHAALRKIIEQAGFSQESQTAIGTALATAVNRLRDSDAKGKVIILLTDGQNNAGDIDPQTAAQLARAMGVRVYTIGAGQRPENLGMLARMFGRMPAPVDEDQLRSIAETTGGRYYRAEDEEALRRIYEAISDLETRPVEAGVIREYHEWFGAWVLVALLCCLGEFALRRTALQGLAAS